jgi:hypothetical protein
LKARILTFAVLINIFCLPVFSQSQNEENGSDYAGGNDTGIDAIPADEPVLINGNGVIYVINSFDFNIEGITRRFALINAAELKKGEEIKGQANLEKYIQDKTQLLINERVLAYAGIDYTIGEAREDGKYPVDLVINTRDSRNIVALPLPQYSSNSGFKVTVKARDYNFLGTMNALRIDLGYRYDEENRTFINFTLDSDTPFEAFGLDWELNFDHDFEYRPDMEIRYYYKNVTGIAIKFPLGPTTLKVGFNESFVLNEENEDKYKIYGEFQEGLYMSSNPYVSWEFPLGIHVGNYGELTYTPNLSATFNHELPDRPLHEHRKGPFLEFGHTLGFGRVDWIGNFLKGFSAEIDNSYSYDFYKKRNDIDALSGNITVGGRAFFTFIDTFGIYSQIKYRQWFLGDYSDSAGDIMRGILDKKVEADVMVSFNLDFVIKVMEARPAYWFNTPQFRIFDMDIHMGPFFDIAFYRNPYYEMIYSEEPFHYKNMLLSSGIEVLFFPVRFRSLFLRASLGFNLSSMSELGKYEIFIGTELHY